MATIDEDVLAYIGLAGKTGAELMERFPGFDVARLVRAQLVTEVPREPVDVEAHLRDLDHCYALTQRGAAAVGIRL